MRVNSPDLVKLSAAVERKWIIVLGCRYNNNGKKSANKLEVESTKTEERVDAETGRTLWAGESFDKRTVEPETFSRFEGVECKIAFQNAMTLQSGHSQKVSGTSVGVSMLNRCLKFRCGYHRNRWLPHSFDPRLRIVSRR